VVVPTLLQQQQRGPLHHTETARHRGENIFFARARAAYRLTARGFGDQVNAAPTSGVYELDEITKASTG